MDVASTSSSGRLNPLNLPSPARIAAPLRVDASTTLRACVTFDMALMLNLQVTSGISALLTLNDDEQ